MTDRNQRLSNDTAKLTPSIVTDAPLLDFDFPALRIGVAEYPEGPTGCTVFYFPDGVTGAVDIRGGAPGVLQHPWHYYDAVCFAGGSLYGLEAMSGVTAELLAQREYAVSFTTIASVGSAIIYDFSAQELRLPRQDVGARRAPGRPQWAGFPSARAAPAPPPPSARASVSPTASWPARAAPSGSSDRPSSPSSPSSTPSAPSSIGKDRSSAATSTPAPASVTIPWLPSSTAWLIPLPRPRPPATPPSRCS